MADGKQELFRTLTEHSVSPEIAEALATELSAAPGQNREGSTLELSSTPEQPAPVGDAHGGLVSSLGHFAIRHEDVKLLAGWTAILNAWAAAGFLDVADAGLTKLLVSVAVSVFGMFWQVRTRGVVLNPLQLKILLALKSRRGGLTVPELLIYVNDSAVFSWTAADVIGELDALRAAGSLYGPVELVKASADRWLATA